MRRVKLAWWAVGVLVVAGAVFVGTRVLGAQAPAEESDLVVTATRGNVMGSVSPTGEVQAEERAVLGFEVDRVALVELHVAAGQRVQEGDVLARVDTAPLQRALDQAEADMLSAEEALGQAEEPYGEAEWRRAELDVAQAEVALQEAQEALDALLEPDLGGAEAAVRDASRQLQQAKDRLASILNDTSTQEQMDTLRWKANVAEVEHGGLLQQTHVTEEGLDRQHLAFNRMMDAKDTLETALARAELDLLTAEYNVSQAEQALAEAQEELAELRAGPEALALAQARNRVAQGELTLATAQETVATMVAGPDEKEIKLARARYDAAVATWEEAREALEGATLVAPFEGTVVSVGAEEGDLVSGSTAVVTLANLGRLRVLAWVDETEIGSVEVGQEAEITFDALAGRRFRGEVLEVPIEGQLVQNVVTYEVPISLEGAEGAGLKPGMTANVKIVTGKREGVVVVPVLAVQQGEEGAVVTVAEAEGAAYATRVELGLSDGQYVEVVRGLMEGDRVVVRLDTTSTQQPLIFGQGRGIGSMLPDVRVGR